MSEGGETVERAILFEGAVGDRQRACVDSWLSDYDFSLLQVDLGRREAGRALFVILRFREDRFTDTTHAALVAAAEHAGGTVVALSELEYQERGHFLSRFAECGWQRLGIGPDEVPKALDEAFSRGGPERRASVRHVVEAPGVLIVGGKKVGGTVENLSAGGALLRTTSPPMVQAKVELEVTLPGGPVRAAATVLNVSDRGVALQFAPVATPVVQARLDALPRAAPLTPSGVEVPAVRPAHERVGPYELLSLLGTGGTSDVHFARVVEGPALGIYVALKRLHRRRAEDPAAVRAFEAEAKALSLLKHPNIVRTIDTGVFDGQHCLVMEVIEGHDLAQILRKCRSRKKPLPVDVACYLAKVLLDALGAVHSAKDESGTAIDLVHGDVSPHNLFVSKTGVIKLGDFGRARRAGTLLSRAVNEGRPSYLAPEALAGEVYASIDLWAAAVTLYELLTLEQPFAGNSLEELTQAIRSKRETPLRERRDECSGPLEAVLKKALEKNQSLRFQSAKAFADTLAVQFHPVRTPRAVPEFVKELFAASGKGR
ncbi:MAG: protein kinase [Archangium sp.]|nr:protein kinase [Archangium sp.]